MLDLSVQINSCGFKLGHSVNWTVFNRTIESQNKTRFGSKVKIRKLGWFGKWHEGAAQKEDQLYKIAGCSLECLGTKFSLVPLDVTSPFGSCSTVASLYLQRNILRKINIFATSPNVPVHGLPNRAETLMGEFHSQCSAIFGQSSALLVGGGSRPGEETYGWSDSDSIIKTSTFYRKIVVVMWEILQPAWNAQTFPSRKE